MVTITFSDIGTGVVQQPLRRRENFLIQCRVLFCAMKSGQRNRQITITTAHLQHRDQLQWISHKLQCFYYAPHVHNVLLTLYTCHSCKYVSHKNMTKQRKLTVLLPN